MNILLTLDYELYLGSRTGSVDNCLITPMNRLQKAVESAGAHFTIFVDATYLLRASQLAIGHNQLAHEVEQLSSHIHQLVNQGHDVQLHIHPHWAYSTYEEGQWILDHKHYKLCDLDKQEACALTASAKAILDDIVGYKTKAFRAGGFSAQPTSMLKEIFEKNGIIADSSVCPGATYDSPQQQYCYATVPDKSMYRFEDDICSENVNGQFIEFPISMHKVSPLFHWRLVANRLLKNPKHRTFGDGVAVKTASESIIARLTSRQNCQATIDGFKISFLHDAYQSAHRQGCEVFTVLGHPKLATPYSVNCLERFVKRAAENGDTFTTISQLIGN